LYTKKDNTTTTGTPHLLMKLDKLNMAKTLFKLPTSDSCGDICAAECLVNGRKVLVVTVYVPANTPKSDCNSLIFSNLAGYSPNVCRMFKILARRGFEDMRIKLAGDFNVNVKDNYNAELVEFMKDTFELDVPSDLCQGTTRSNFCSDIVFGRNVDNLSCMNYFSYYSYHTPILSRTNHQAPQLTDVTANCYLPSFLFCKSPVHISARRPVILSFVLVFFFQACIGLIHQIKPRTPLSASFAVHYLPIILPLNAT
jgi:hypothetical protein